MSDTAGGPPKKKQKMEKPRMEGPSVGLTRLTRHQVDFTPELSPGALHSNRVAIYAPPEGPANFTAFFASGREVRCAAAPAAAAPALGERGKGGVYLPQPAGDVRCLPLPEAALRAEIQSLTLSPAAPDGTAVLAASDAYGRAVLARLHFGDGSDTLPRLMGIEQLHPAALEGAEGGWTGVALAADQPSQAAVARHFPKDITLFDGPMPLRTIHTMYRPNAVALLPASAGGGDAGGGPLVAAAEGPMVSVWDVRAAGRGARVARLTPNVHAGHLYCLAAVPGGGGAAGAPVLGAAGGDRSVLVWDPRTWRMVDRWSNCLKYEATSLHFLSSNPAYCLVGGQDYEVVVGRWAGEQRSRLGGGHRTSGAASDDGADSDGGGAAASDGGALSFRGDSRWTGLAKAAGRDVVAGLTVSKQLFVAELATSPWP